MFVFMNFSLKIPSNVVGRFTDILSKLIQTEGQFKTTQSLPLVYSCLIYIVVSIRKNEGNKLNSKLTKLLF